MFNLELFLFKTKFLVENYGLIGVFLSTFIEEIISPIPSVLVVVFISIFYFFEKTFSFEFLWRIFIFCFSGTLGSVLGSLFIFLVFYFVGKPAIDKFGKFFGLKWSDFETIERFFHKRGENFILIFLRSLPLIPSSVVNAFFGVLRFHWFKFIILSFIGIFIRIFLLSLIGWQLSFGVEEMKKAIILGEIGDLSGWFITLIILILLLVVFYKKSFQNYRNKLRSGNNQNSSQ